ncbi:MAG: acyl-CoA dehydrogenase family protein [Chloroflexi bacterium]|nr:acyl-CoA dehydrogenase family protein [Chloroflexota bacterium]
MDFRFTEEQERFREEVRDFLEEELRKGSFQPREDAWTGAFSLEFSRKIAEKGWIGLTWPKEYGGQGRTYLDRLVFMEEVLKYGAPLAAHWMAERQMGPSIINYGTEEQKKYFLPRIIRAEVTFCAGMSEPGAGSDLASLQTRAVEDDNGFVINGQKVWTSRAHLSHYIYLVARTDPNVPKHKGISEFIVDLKLPGITINPLTDMSGGQHFNEVFFDNVRIPKTALIGVRNRGWYQIAAQLDYERSGLERIMSNYPLLSAVTAYAKETRKNGKPLSEDPLVREKLAKLTVEFEVGRLLIYRVAWMLTQGKLPNYQTALAKTYGSEFEQRLANCALDIFGLRGQLLAGSKWALYGGRPPRNYLFSRGYTIQGGTSEILRNVIAIRGLGLPTG